MYIESYAGAMPVDPFKKQVGAAEREEKGSGFGDVLGAITGGKGRSRVMPKENSHVPYSNLEKDGMIQYKGVVFVCDDQHNRLCLGDVSDKSKCLNIPLSGGGCLLVNRDNLGDLAQAIGMFSSEDVNRIMRAIAEDNKAQQMKNEIEDEKSSIGKVKVQEGEES